MLNVAFNGLAAGGDAAPAAAPMFWDLRVRSLEAQALEPLKALEEMRGGAYSEDHAVAAVVVAAECDRRSTAGCLLARSADQRP